MQFFFSVCRPPMQRNLRASALSSSTRVHVEFVSSRARCSGSVCDRCVPCAHSRSGCLHQALSPQTPNLAGNQAESMLVSPADVTLAFMVEFCVISSRFTDRNSSILHLSSGCVHAPD